MILSVERRFDVANHDVGAGSAGAGTLVDRWSLALQGQPVATTPLVEHRHGVAHQVGELEPQILRVVADGGLWHARKRGQFVSIPPPLARAAPLLATRRDYV